MCTYKGYRDTGAIIANCNTLEPEWSHHNHPAARVIAQQYSLSAFVSLPFHSHKEKFGVFKTFDYLLFVLL
jgi:hypothetical protein